MALHEDDPRAGGKVLRPDDVGTKAPPDVSLFRRNGREGRRSPDGQSRADARGDQAETSASSDGPAGAPRLTDLIEAAIDAAPFRAPDELVGLDIEEGRDGTR